MFINSKQKMSKKLFFLGLLCPAVFLTACGGSSGEAGREDCAETGEYACQTGETEPLYKFQWALKYFSNFFSENSDVGAYGGGYDLNVEPVHKKGFKGQGVNVLVLDIGVDFENEDLSPNADYSMSWNYETNAANPAPAEKNDLTNHGTMAAGVIAAAQNGKGIMGIAPRAKLGGAVLSGEDNNKEIIEIFGGADWSKKVHIISASMYWGSGVAERYSVEGSPYLQANRAMKSYREGKGIVYVKSAGNSFVGNCHGELDGYYDCAGPHNHVENLEANTIVVSALNAKGQASSYSSAGSLLWVTGMGGESGRFGRYGEKSGLNESELAQGATGSGPRIYTTDFPGCSVGAVESSVATDFEKGISELQPGVKDNPRCEYATMGGTSAAAPTISGVIALMLSANQDLTWRDVRDILRLSSRKVDVGYEKRIRNDYNKTTAFKLDKPYNSLFDLSANKFIAQSGDERNLLLGASRIPLEIGWQKNSAGNHYSNWYGFGLPDAEEAVRLAKKYKINPKLSKSAQQIIPDFVKINTLHGFTYQKMDLLGEFQGKNQLVDEFQVLLDGENICLGSMGVVVESPAGTKSILKMPLDFLGQDNVKNFSEYGLGSYAFYGENAAGVWKVYSVASNPNSYPVEEGVTRSCDAAPANGKYSANAKLLVQARVIAQ